MNLLNTYICKICGNNKGNRIYHAKEMMLGLKHEFVYFECSECECLQIADIPENIGDYYPSHYYSFKKVKNKWLKNLSGSLIKQKTKASILPSPHLAGFLFTEIVPSKNVKFKTYAVTRIRGAIFDELRQIDWVPRSVRQKSREIEDTIVTLEARLGRTASDSEIAQALNMSEDEYHRTVMKVSGTSILSLNEVWYSGDDNDSMSIGDSIESPSSLNPDVIAEREEIKKVIIQSINELPEKEKMVIVLYYHEDLTFKEIGEVLQVSESRISQLHTKANLRLRAKLTNFRRGIM